MNFSKRVIFKVFALLTFIEGAGMLFCGFVGFIYKEMDVGPTVAYLGIILMLIGAYNFWLMRLKDIRLRLREGYLIAALGWIYCSLLGSLPFILSSMGYGILDSVFESFAAFSTTGCTTFDLLEMPRTLILWRAFANWVGGMGILVLLVSVFPALGIGGQSIASAEATGSSMEKLSAKYSNTGRFLYIVYMAFTLLEFILLWIGPLGFFDSLSNALSTISTGGLVIRRTSATAFSGWYSNAVVLTFSLLSSLNYMTYFLIYSGQFRVALKNIETRVYLCIIGVSVILVSLCLVSQGTCETYMDALGKSLFEVISYSTTGGYSIYNITQWPKFVLAVLLGLTFIGGCTTSTSGSLKVYRVIVLFKLIKRGIYQGIHPNSVVAVKVQGKPLKSDVVSRNATHIVLFYLVFMVASILLGFEGFDLETTISTAIAIFSNTGITFTEIGYDGYFGMFSDFSKIIMCPLMIAGRLEIYSILLLFSPQFWTMDKSVRI